MANKGTCRWCGYSGQALVGRARWIARRRLLICGSCRGILGPFRRNNV
jgi:hypothetical protein